VALEQQGRRLGAQLDRAHADQIDADPIRASAGSAIAIGNVDAKAFLRASRSARPSPICCSNIFRSRRSRIRAET